MYGSKHTKTPHAQAWGVRFTGQGTPRRTLKTDE